MYIFIDERMYDIEGRYIRYTRSITTMNEYSLNNKTYIDLKDVRNEHKSYCKGTRTNNQLIEKKNFKDYIFGRIGVDDKQLVATEKLSRKFGSIFVNKE